MTRLSVNINKIATLRNARGGNNPDVIKVAQDCERFGAQGITVHPRPDERHIKYNDVLQLKKVVKTEFNIEGYPDARYLKLIKEISPEQATLVPDPPEVLTSNAGWNAIAHREFLKDTIAQLKESAGRVSLFVEASPKMVEAVAETGSDRIELYTEPYASAYASNREKAVANFIEAAKVARDANLGVNAGHDLDLNNLRFLKTSIPWLEEVSIGHALISDAIYYGLENTIQLYLRELK